MRRGSYAVCLRVAVRESETGSTSFISECAENVEEVTAAKGWLQRHMPDDQRYSENQRSEPLTHHIDMDLTYSRSRSFRRLCHAVDEW